MKTLRTFGEVFAIMALLVLIVGNASAVTMTLSVASGIGNLQAETWSLTRTGHRPP